MLHYVILMWLGLIQFRIRATHARPAHLIKIIAQVITKNEIAIFGTDYIIRLMAQPLRDYIHVCDLADAIFLRKLFI